MWTRACRDRHAVPERPVPRRPSGVVDSDGRTHGVRQLMSNTALIDRLVMASNWTLSTWKDKLDDHVWAALFPKDHQAAAIQHILGRGDRSTARLLTYLRDEGRSDERRVGEGVSRWCRSR